VSTYTQKENLDFSSAKTGSCVVILGVGIGEAALGSRPDPEATKVAFS
jgi:hypothetical protein